MSTPYPQKLNSFHRSQEERFFYQQLVLNDKSALLLMINTPKGLFHAMWLQFGVSTTVAIFFYVLWTHYLQEYLVLSLIWKTHSFLARRKQSMMSAYRNFCNDSLRLDYACRRRNAFLLQSKWSFSVFVWISKKSAQPIRRRELSRIHQHLETRRNCFLGLLQFYNCNKATVLEPLHCLLDQTATWEWKAKHEDA